MAPGSIALAAAIGLLPVLVLLLVLVVMDSFRLVSRRRLLLALGAGVAAALIAAVISWALLARSGLGVDAIARYVSPALEELLKAVYPLLMIRARRLGFTVDAAIVGFAVGAGFALFENTYYAVAFSDLPRGYWLVRGFGTGVMHGSCTAVFTILALTARLRPDRRFPVMVLLAYVIATVLHSLYNHFLVSPLVATVGLTLSLPVAMALVYRASEARLRRWLGEGYATDVEILRLTRTGQLGSSPVGQYLRALRAHFTSTTVADMYCLLALRAELALRAKGNLMLREAGFVPERRPEWREQIAELDHLEGAIGRTGLLALRPLVRSSHRDRWQLELLKDG